VAWATLLREGVADPSRHIVLVSSAKIATILVSNQPLSDEDLSKLRSIAEQMQFKFIFFPGEPTQARELRRIAEAHTLADLDQLRYAADFDYSPAYDSSPYFFNAVRIQNLPRLVGQIGRSANLRALFFVFAFMFAALILVIFTILFPLHRWAKRRGAAQSGLAGGIAYFVAIGLGFMLVEMAMMQQLSIFLGHPIYSLVVVLTGLILSTGVGSLVSDRLPLRSGAVSRVPALAVVLALLLYSASVIPILHRFVAGALSERAILSLALVAPCGFLMGFCFPVGLRWLREMKHEENLPWMWALNGAAATLGSFVGILISMETSITACVLTGAALYLVAAGVLPRRSALVAAPVTDHDLLP
jgi:hypothetical protein